jgi:hypothetical protein
MQPKTNNSTRPFTKLSMLALATVLLFALGIRMSGQQAQSGVIVGNVQITGLPDDWTFHHLVFSNPGTQAEATAKGKSEEWFRIVNDPRYLIQQLKRGAPAQGPAAPDVASIETTEQAVNAPSAEALTSGSTAATAVTRGKEKINKDWSMSMGSGAKVGAGQYPAKFSFSTTSASCANDFVVYNTGLTGTTGSSGQPTIIAYNNLYSGCGGSVPSVYWQYNTAYAQDSSTADSSTITTSVVFTGPVGVTTPQVAFVENTSGQASLVLLKWTSNSSLEQMSTAGTNNVLPANYYNCTAPCMTKIPFETASGTATGKTATNSSPFYDYINDVIYVGDNSGLLHKFQHIYNNSSSNPPAEITGGGTSSDWPQTMSSGNTLTSPVYDSGTSGNVFVGTSAGTLIRIPAGGGSSNIILSGALTNGGAGVVDAPLVDSNAESVYVVVAQDNNNTHCNPGNPCFAGVYQFAAAFSATNTGTEKTLGGDNNSGSAFDGAFDNIYFSSSSSSSPSGNLYVCGSSSGGNTPTLYQVPITNNAIGTPVTGPALATASTTCSPVTEFYNTSGTATDWIFLSVQADNKTTSPISCPSGTGCLMSFSVTSASGFGTSKATTATAAETSGTSGTIIDNALTSPTGTSQVYLSPLGNQSCAGNGTTGSGTGGCAIQASQAALQ